MQGALTLSDSFIRSNTEALSKSVTARMAASAILLVMLVHAVETAKFVTAWTHYLAAVRALAVGVASDPAIGDPHFASADRIGADLNRLSSVAHLDENVAAARILLSTEDLHELS